jgi:hypothetical protein
MNSKNNPQGNLTVSHYMTILQKLTSFINHDLMADFFKLDDNYNFQSDPKNTRLKNNQKDYKNYLLRTDPQGDPFIKRFIIDNSERLVQSDIPNIFNYINRISAREAISYDPENLLVPDKTTKNPTFNIVDNDLQNQIQIKQIREAAKNKRATLTKEEVAGKVWKYRYLPPDPRTSLFERNAVDAAKFTEVPIMPEFTRLDYKSPQTDLSKKSIINEEIRSRTR